MKRYLLFVLTVVVFFAFVFESVNAYCGQYPSVNSTLCTKYLGMAEQALENNNLALAKLFARKAIQADVFNIRAWKEYDSIIVKMSGGNGAQTNTPPVTSMPKTPSVSTPQAPSGGGAFEGC